MIRLLRPLGWKALDIRHRLPDHRVRKCGADTAGTDPIMQGCYTPEAVRGGFKRGYRSVGGKWQGGVHLGSQSSPEDVDGTGVAVSAALGFHGC